MSEKNTSAGPGGKGISTSPLRLSSLGIGLTWLLLSTSSASSLDLTNTEREWLADHPIIRFGADPSWPPFSMDSKGRLDGLDQDLIQLISTRLNVRFEYVPSERWDDTVVKLEKGEIDFVSGLANLPERPLNVLYTTPYTSFPVAMIMRTDGPFFTSLEQVDREGLILAAPSDYAPTLHVETHHPGIRILHTGTSLEALTLVSEGEADATLENLGVAAHLIRINGLANLKITGPTQHHFDPAFGVRKEFPELRSILDKAISSVTPQERLHLYQKWILVEISRMWEWRKVALAGAVLVGIAALVIGLVSAWNQRLGLELGKRRLVEDSLRLSEERFRHFFETMDDAYFLTHPDGRIQFVNETAVDLLKIGSRPVVERLNLANFLKRPGDLGRYVDQLRSSDRLRDQSIEFSGADGSPLVCRCQIRLLRDAADDEVGIEWMVRPESKAGPDPQPAA